MCRTPTTAARRASSRSSIWWRPGAASSWPGSKASSGRKPQDFGVGGRKPLEHAAGELEVARAPRENDVAEVGAEPQLLHHRTSNLQSLARQPQLVRIYLPAAAQQPLDRVARPGQARVAFQQQAADLAAFEQPPHAADDLVLVAIDVDLHMVGCRQRAALDQVIDRKRHASLPEAGFGSVVPARLAEVVKRVAGGEIAQQQARHLDRLVADRGAVSGDAGLSLVEEDVAVELGIVLRFWLESVHFGAGGAPGIQAVDAAVRHDCDENFAGGERLDPVDRAGLLREQRLDPPLTCRRADAVAQRASIEGQLGARERPLRLGELLRHRHLAAVVERRGGPGLFFYGQPSLCGYGS